MSYKEKFDASRDRAHSKVIATKILEKLGELRAKAANSATAPRRWIWELIQNAKDVHPEGGVKIQIEFASDTADRHVTVRHNGRPFSTDDIRFLIEQISTKDRTKDESGKHRTTGKFGTGFLTTHLLSDIVYVEGIAKEPGLKHTKFELELDRSSDDIEEILAAIERAKHSIEALDTRNPCSNYVENDFNTAFRYPLEDDVSLRFVRAGLTDLNNCLPYSLVFVDAIDSVEVVPGKRFHRRSPGTAAASSDPVNLATVVIRENGKPRSFTVAYLTKGFTSIAVPLDMTNGLTTLLAIGDNVPRLFCDFPLVGTENFAFPTLINNPNFNPTDPRHGIFLTNPLRPNPQINENKTYIRDAVGLFFQLLEHASKHAWQDLHLLAHIPSADNFDWLDPQWFQREVLNPIREKLLREKIVTTARGRLEAILSDDKAYLWFPHGGDKELRDKIWHSASSWFPHRLPRRDDVELWHNVLFSWPHYGKLTVSQLARFVESEKTLEKLAKALREVEIFKWLNDFYDLIRSDEAEFDNIVNRYSLYPNQNGDFCKHSQLCRDTGDIGDEFKDILKLLGRDIRSELVADAVNGDFDPAMGKNRAFAVKEIISEVDQKAGDRETAMSFRAAFRKLLAYFQREPQQARALFPKLYANKHYLYDDEEILDNIGKAEQLAGLLAEFSVKDVAELRELLTSRTETKNGVLPITQEILASMGITSIEEWREAIEDRDLAALFSHESTPTADMFVYAQSLISKAKQRVIAHLRTLIEYDMSQLEEVAPTILAGIFKHDESINIVVRPGYRREVIIYYRSERDVLDYVSSELWVDIDDSTEPQRITLGHILKTAQIVKFPI